jgi:prophage antirepressor-like protein
MTDLINSIDISLAFNDENIRIVGKIEEPMFVVKDICKILGLSNVTEVLRNIPDKWKYSVKLNTSTQGLQTSNVVNEAGLYKIIMRSNKPISQPFQEFVCEEILPSIRKTGEYKYQKILDEKNKLEEENKIIKDEKTKFEQEVKKLTKKYIKQPKEVFDEKNVVYLMTSEDSEKNGEYNVGKAIDLSKRKENYNQNKLHDFKVIYYISCKNSKFMDLIESVVLMKLEKYRCKAGRDVFLLPKLDYSSKEFVDIVLFTNIFDECLKFYEDVDEAIYPKRTLQEDKDKRKERNKKYQEEHKEEIKEKMHEYYEDNKEILSDIKKVYYENNVDIIAEKHKKYYEKNKEAVIENVMEYYKDNKEQILEERKEFYKDNKEQILEERSKYYEENYKTKIATQRQKKETCECGMIVSHYCMKRHKGSARHKTIMEKFNI